MSKVRLGAAPARRLFQALALLMPLTAAGPAASEHCLTPICEHEVLDPEGQVVELPPDPVPLSVDYVHDFISGYDKHAKAYRGDWLEDVVFDPPGRPIRAVSCSYQEAALPQELADEADPGTCGDLRVRLAPDGVAAIRWTLVDPEPPPLGLGEEVIEQQTYDLGQARPIPGSGCIFEPAAHPLPVVVPPQACAFEASAPLPPLSAGDTYRYTVRIEWFDGAGEVLRSGSQDIPIPRTAPLIVSLGESFASGEGNPDVIGKSERTDFGLDDCFEDTSQMIVFDNLPDMITEPTWFEPEGHRSLRSAPALAAKELLEDRPYLVFLSLAKSGSVVQDDEPDEGPKADLVEQLGTVAELMQDHPDHKIDVLLISIGGNDVGFADVLRGLTTGSLKRPDALEEFEDDLDVLTGDAPGEDPDELRGYPLIDQTIRQAGLNVSNIFITEYPTSLFDRADNMPGPGCGVFEDVTFEQLTVEVEDARLIKTMGERLNDEIHRTPELYGWRVVDGIAERFKSHGYCLDDSTRYFLWAEQSCHRQGDFEGTMHPNRNGTAAAAQEIERHLRDVLPAPNAQDPILDP